MLPYECSLCSLFPHHVNVSNSSLCARLLSYSEIWPHMSCGKAETHSKHPGWFLDTLHGGVTKNILQLSGKVT